MHIPTYVGLQVLRIATRSFSNIFVSYSIALVVTSSSLFCYLQILYQFYFSRFYIALSRTELFINLCNAFPSLSPFFSASILYCVLNSHSVLAIVYVMYFCFALFQSQSQKMLQILIIKHILFFAKKVSHQFFNITNRNTIKISNL